MERIENSKFTEFKIRTVTGLFGDSINVMLAAAAFNFKRAMRALLCLFQEVLSGWIKPFLQLKNLYFWQVHSCYADMRTRELAF